MESGTLVCPVFIADPELGVNNPSPMPPIFCRDHAGLCPVGDSGITTTLIRSNA